MLREDWNSSGSCVCDIRCVGLNDQQQLVADGLMVVGDGGGGRSAHDLEDL